MAEARLQRHAETECSTGVPAHGARRVPLKSHDAGCGPIILAPGCGGDAYRLLVGGENGVPSVVVYVRTSDGNLRSVASGA